jgi:ribosomal protein S20
VLGDAGMNDSLRSRVAEAIERFNEALSEAEKDETLYNLEQLAGAADRLMRAVGRILIETKGQLQNDRV